MKKEYKYWIIDSEMEDSDDISPLQSEIKSQAWQKLSKQVPIEEQKSDVNFEILEDEDGDAESQQPTYQIRPKLSEKEGVNRVAAYKELDTELVKNVKFATVDGVNLAIFTKRLYSEKSVKEADEVWTWESLFTQVASELNSENQSD
ncbi:intraflagellar transport protein 43 homolog isoform X3 [Belonocnema kinseyi]|uniref:intraflagellar transport protein 43 homolog isoform X3 n=1 Tax=Belonocnema kinseyi TaxID=2817044 RepID=UPI00143D17C2|nr:intraflagellar transport protein 43 homolog isoform X3 [Belonocnema kinseyi]